MKKPKLIRRMRSSELKSKHRKKLLTNASKANFSVIKHKKQKDADVGNRAQAFAEANDYGLQLLHLAHKFEQPHQTHEPKEGNVAA